MGHRTHASVALLSVGLLCGLVAPAYAAASYQDDPDYQRLAVILLNNDQAMSPGFSETITYLNSDNTGNPLFQVVNNDAANGYVNSEHVTQSEWTGTQLTNHLSSFRGCQSDGTAYVSLLPGSYKYQKQALARLGKSANTNFETAHVQESPLTQAQCSSSILDQMLAHNAPGPALGHLLEKIQEDATTIDANVTATPYLLDPTDTLYNFTTTKSPVSVYKAQTVTVFVDANQNIKSIYLFRKDLADNTLSFTYAYPAVGVGTPVPAEPAGAKNVDQAALDRMNNKITAEVEVAGPVATKIKNKASYLITKKGYRASAKTIRIAASLVAHPPSVAVHNTGSGVAATGTVLGVTGSVCVYISSGKAATKAC